MHTQQHVCTLQHTQQHVCALQHPLLHVLVHTNTEFNKLQHTATPVSTLHHTLIFWSFSKQNPKKNSDTSQNFKPKKKYLQHIYQGAPEKCVPKHCHMQMSVLFNFFFPTARVECVPNTVNPDLIRKF